MSIFSRNPTFFLFRPFNILSNIIIACWASRKYAQRQPTTTLNTVEYEIFRNATIKGFELVLDLGGKLLRKGLKLYYANPQTVDTLTFKEVLRHAAKHHLLTTEAVTRWFKYRDNRNNTADDYGVVFTKESLPLLPVFLDDARDLQKILQKMGI